MKVDIDDYLYREDAEAYKQRLIEIYGEEIVSPIIEELEEENLFNWIDVIYENRKEILDVDNVIGTEDLDIDGLLEYDKMIDYILESDKTEWSDPNRFNYILYSRLSKKIEEEFDSTEEAVRFISEEDDDEEEIAEFMEMLEETRNNPFVDSPYENDLAVLYGIQAQSAEQSLVNWETDDIEQYDYILLTVEKDGYDKTGEIAMKIENINREKIYRSDVSEKSEEDIEDNTLLGEYIMSIETHVLAYEDEVTDLYKNHKYATKDENELCSLGITEEENMEFLKENPLPL